MTKISKHIVKKDPKPNTSLIIDLVKSEPNNYLSFDNSYKFETKKENEDSEFVVSHRTTIFLDHATPFYVSKGIITQHSKESGNKKGKGTFTHERTQSFEEIMPISEDQIIVKWKGVKHSSGEIIIDVFPQIIKDFDEIHEKDKKIHIQFGMEEIRRPKITSNNK